MCGMGTASNPISGNTSRGRLFISEDFGTTWTETRPAGDTNQCWREVKMLKDASIYIATTNTRAYISYNRGGTWSELRPKGDVDADWTLVGM